jgi:hypothetical protein
VTGEKFLGVLIIVGGDWFRVGSGGEVAASWRLIELLCWTNLGETTNRIGRDEGQQTATLFPSAALSAN